MGSEGEGTIVLRLSFFRRAKREIKCHCHHGNGVPVQRRSGCRRHGRDGLEMSREPSQEGFQKQHAQDEGNEPAVPKKQNPQGPHEQQLARAPLAEDGDDVVASRNTRVDRGDAMRTAIGREQMDQTSHRNHNEKGRRDPTRDGWAVVTGRIRRKQARRARYPRGRKQRAHPWSSWRWRRVLLSR